MKILHLSDVHLGIRKKARHPDRSAHHFTRRDSVTPEPKHVVKCIENSSLPDEKFEVLVLSGDLGWSGSEQDYAFADVFVEGLRSLFPNSTFVICGGNHDVDVRRSVADRNRQNKFFDFTKRQYGSDFADRFPLFDDESTDIKEKRHRHIFFEEGDDFVVCAINTGASINSTRDPVFVDPACMREIGKLLDNSPSTTSKLKIFVQHHHLLPFTEPPWGATIDVEKIKSKPDTSILANSAEVQQWLHKRHFDVVLHGHKHNFHARSDRLWTWSRDVQLGRSLLVVGTGSAGVTRDEMADEIPHIVTSIDLTKVDTQKWQASVAAHPINRDATEIGLGAPQTLSVGTIEPEAQLDNNFVSESTSLCHAAIKERLEDKGTVVAFSSVIRNPEYQHPATCSLGHGHARLDVVEASLDSLYSNGFGRAANTAYGSADSDSLNYRISHGTRIFGELPSGKRVIDQVVESIQQNSSRSYVSLWDPRATDADTVAPGMVGIQFVPNQAGVLDVVGHFRNLELSFWWCVNQLEMFRLAKYVCDCVRGGNFVVGSITTQSAMASWRSDPRPVFVDEIDKLHPPELFAKLYDCADHTDSCREVSAWFSEKAQSISENNFVVQNTVWALRTISDVLSNKLQKADCKRMRDCADKCESALLSVTDRRHDIHEIRKTLAQSGTALANL